MDACKEAVNAAAPMVIAFNTIIDENTTWYINVYELIYDIVAFAIVAIDEGVPTVYELTWYFIWDLSKAKNQYHLGWVTIGTSSLQLQVRSTNSFEFVPHITIAKVNQDYDDNQDADADF